jgi:beta-mannosidase
LSAPGPVTAPAEGRTLPLTSDAGVSWRLRASSLVAPSSWAAAREIPATVPGEVHTDLLAAGVIVDPVDADNEALLAWVGRTCWTYVASFSWTDNGHARHDLVAEGLDTVATVRVNGTVVGHTRNQHRSYRFDVTALLLEGHNELVVEFEAPVDAAERLAEELGPRPHTNQHPFNAIRKMAANYGWDWGPDVATAGIWKPIGIQSWSGVRLSRVRPLASVEATTGVLTSHVELEWAGVGEPDGALVRIEVAGVASSATVVAGQDGAVVLTRVSDAALWWPRGYGEQPLYDVQVTLEAGGTALDRWGARVGFRTVQLDTAADEHGSPFALSVNGAPVYVRGANWIPDDAFVTRITPERYERGVRDAIEANMNLLRVWGGGLYESEEFYRVCDELGVLVWQDFLFACAAYCEDEPLRSEVEAEAREAISRLSRHASLAIWNGCNENIWGYVEWAWRLPLAGRSWGRGYYFELLPALVAELDPRTPYTPGSPFSFSEFIHPNDPRTGSMHIWDVWNERDYGAYRDYDPRFVAEFGFQGPPAFSTLTSVVHDDPLDPYGPMMLAHQKATEGNLKLERGLGEHLPKWRNIDEWHWATQLNQARAVGFGIEHFRSLSPLNRGAILWQLNDSWPVVSWAAVDSSGIRKPLWHTLRRVYADRLLTIQPRDGVPTLIAHNESSTTWKATVVIVRASTSEGGEVLAEQELTIDVASREVAVIAMDDAVRAVGEPEAQYLAARVSSVDADGVDPAFWYFVEDTVLRLRPRPAVTSAHVASTDDGYALTVTATALVKDLTLLVDRLHPDARVDSGMVTLTAGDSHTFHIQSEAIDPAGLSAETVLRSANDLVAKDAHP